LDQPLSDGAELRRVHGDLPVRQPGG
jgi:hypothetical protein